MTFISASFDRETGGSAKLRLSPEELSEGRLSGEIQIQNPDEIELPATFLLTNSRDILVNPYEIRINSKQRETIKISIKITGPNPKFKFETHDPHRLEYPFNFAFNLQDTETLRLSQEFHDQGVTEELLEEIEDKYKGARSPFLGLIRDVKHCFDFSTYMDLWAATAEYDEQAYQDFTQDRHKFFKNLILMQGVGSQYPIRDHDEFLSRIHEYGRHDELEPINQAKAIEKLLEDASTHGTNISEICTIEETFIETAADIRTRYFVHLLTEALINDFPVSTATTTFENEFSVAAKSLVQSRYNDQEVKRTFEEIRDTAYETRSPDEWEQALKAAETSDSSDFRLALADLLYWFTETTNEIPNGIKSKVYATAATLYTDVGNEFMANAARYEAYISEGFIKRRIGSYENARQEFVSAIDIGSNWDRGQFNEVFAFVQSVETDIKEYREQGDFMEAFEKAEYGYSELTEGSYRDKDTERYESRLLAWKDDLKAQNQSLNGQFEEAIETTNDAIAGFRAADAESLARTAQTRRYQLQAIQSQLDLNFGTAADHHLNARDEATNRHTAHVHHVNADLCLVKHHLLNEELEDARNKIAEFTGDNTIINNLRILIEVYEDFINGEQTPVSEVVDQLETRSDEEEPQNNRHITYNGDYVSAVIHVVGAQRLGQKNVPSPVLEHIARAAIKNAISGGSSHEWAEISELSQIDAKNTWRLLLPSVIQNDLEYTEYNAAKGSYPNYSASGLKLLATLEGYLRVLVEYYAKREYGDQWEDVVVSRNKITLGDIYTFFESDSAAEQIPVREDIYTELQDLRYFEANSSITDVRNELGHEELSKIDETVFEDLKSHVFEIMRRSAFECPVIAEIDNVNEQHQIYFAGAELKWNRLPRRAEISTTAKLEPGQAMYLPPDPSIESGMVEIDANGLELCEMVPKEVDKSRDITN